MGEVAVTGMDRVLLCQSARFHQGDKRFPPDRRNSQCTAISVVSIVALQLAENITRDLLDQILIDGDSYDSNSKRLNNISYDYLSPEDLLPSIAACGYEVRMKVYHIADGFFSSGNASQEIAETINSNALEHEGNLTRTGFLFVSDAKTVAFLITPVLKTCARRNFFMFNPHSVDNRNRFPLNKPSQGAARLFRCLSVEALVGLLLAGRHGQMRGGWQIYRVKVF